MSDERLKLAVFIDFDNIEIGVKDTLGKEFDVSLVLEALKERGEVVTKVAYGDWPRAGEQSREMTQHAVHMVQRNVTPRGDKNGADINLALDALEMAFTRHHINAFAIVGGDSDFIALVEKLKQYDKRVFVVGGRSFTSHILQRNCHEFIAYENLLKDKEAGDGGRAPRSARAPARPSAETRPLAAAFPNLQRAMKILAEREVAPQLGVLKSTLLQLDPTFSERDYGTGSFQEFMQKMKAARYVKLRRTERGYMVDLEAAESDKAARDQEVHPAPVDSSQLAAEAAPAQPVVTAPPAPTADHTEAMALLKQAVAAPAQPVVTAPPAPTADRTEAIALLKQAVAALSEKGPNRPLYMRQVRQALRVADPSFDERRYGFRSTLDLLHEGQRHGLLRLQRDHKGVWRIFPVLPSAALPGAGEQPAAGPALPADGGISEPMVQELAPEATFETPSAVPESFVAAYETSSGEVAAPTIEEAATLEVSSPGVPLPTIEGVAPPTPARKGRRPRAVSTSARSGQRRTTARRKPKKRED